MRTVEQAGARAWRRGTVAVATAGVLAACSGGHDSGAAQVNEPARPAIQPRAVASTPTVTAAVTPSASPTTLTPSPVTAPPAPGASATPTVTPPVAAPPPVGLPAPAVTAAPTLAACTAGTISFKPGEVGFALGHWGFPVVLTNTGQQACTLYGYPGMAASSGTTLIAGQTGRGNSYLYRDPGPTLVTLSPGAQASFGLATGESASNGPQCQQSNALAITLPDQRQSTTVPFAVDVCPPLVGTVTAIQAGASGPTP